MGMDGICRDLVEIVRSLKMEVLIHKVDNDKPIREQKHINNQILKGLNNLLIYIG